MKRTLGIIGSLLTMLIFAIALTVAYPKQRGGHQLTDSPTTSIWVLSDTHFIAPSLHDNGRAFKKINQTTAGKDLYYQPVAIRALVHEALQAKPAAIVLTGDDTFNGEEVSAQSLAKRLQPLQKAGIHVLVIPGNHDIEDGWARAFKGKQQLVTNQISTTDFRRIFNDGYHNATSEDANSLSYAINLNAHYKLLMLDDNIYSSQPSNSAPTTNGRLKASTLRWLTQQLKAAKKEGRTPLVFMHHNLYPHNSRVHGGFVLNNAPAVRKLLKTYDVPVDFSGHMHAQDIERDPAGKDPTIEVVDGAFSISPSSYGVVTLAPHRLTYAKHHVNVPAVLTTKEKKNPDLLHYQRYMKRLFTQSGQEMATEALVWQQGLTGKKLHQGVNFIGELNWRFFTGADSPADVASAKLTSDPGYKIDMANPQLREYIKSIMVDHNMPDNHLTVRIK